MKTVSVLGCGGFIGSHLLERLLSSAEWRCIGVDREKAKIRHLLGHPRFRFVEGDLYSLPEAVEIIRESDIIVSLASICNPAYYNTEPLKVIASNYDLPVQVVRACARFRKRLIHFSTSEVYGKTPAALGFPMQAREQVLREESTHLILGPVERQRWSYACAKQLLERVIYAFGEEEGLDYTVIRPFNFVGPRMDYLPGVDGDGVPRVMACFMDSLIRNKPLRVVDGGRNRRVFTWIGDAVDAVMAVLEKPVECMRRTFNIGNPENELSIQELAQRLLEIYPRVSGLPVPGRCKIVDVDSGLFYGKGYDDSDRRIPDIGLAGRLLGWHPKTGIDQTLEKTMEGFLKQYNLLHV